MMKIKQAEIFHLRMPLKFTFKTAQTRMDARETLVIKVTDEEGNNGYGEVVAFNEPFYTRELLSEDKEQLRTRYLPRLLAEKIDHPFDLHQWIGLDYPMAVAGVENALLDLYARSLGQPIMQTVFPEPRLKQIEPGMVLGDLEYSVLKEKIALCRQEGYQRFKVKIKPADGLAKLTKIRTDYPDIGLLADANMSYRLDQIPELKGLDDFNLLCLEEPFPAGDFQAYQHLQAEIKTPVCLDESIQTVDDLKKAISLKALQVVNLKLGRIGGLYYARQMIELCRQHGIGYWIGSMVESGISKILHVHLASLPDTYIPGDLSPSRRYFVQDVIRPEITLSGGEIKVPQGAGLGVVIEEKVLQDLAVDYIKLGGV